LVNSRTGSGRRAPQRGETPAAPEGGAKGLAAKGLAAKGPADGRGQEASALNSFSSTAYK
jgi:hypothetical protein